MECTKSVHPREGIRFREAVSECGELIRLNDANRVHLSWSGLPSQRPESRLIRLLDVRPASSTWVTRSPFLNTFLIKIVPMR
jgi:hypothetical protein